MIILDHAGKQDKDFAIAGCEDADANSATTSLLSPGFKGNEHPNTCLNFWYTIEVICHSSNLQSLLYCFLFVFFHIRQFCAITERRRN